MIEEYANRCHSISNIPVFFFLAECEFSGIYFIIKLNEISLIISLIKNMIYILLYNIT